MALRNRARTPAGYGPIRGYPRVARNVHRGRMLRHGVAQSRGIVMNQSKLAVCFGISLGLVVGGCTEAPAQAEDVATSEEALSSSICPAGVPVTLAPAADQTIKSSLTGVGVQ